MKLWVDDIRQAPDATWQVARTATEAIRAIARYEFEVISLDHDISHYENLDESDIEQNVVACKETFAAVAYFIAEKYSRQGQFIGEETWAPKVELHTSNTTAGDEMALVLKEHGIMAEKRYVGTETSRYPHIGY